MNIEVAELQHKEGSEMGMINTQLLKKTMDEKDCNISKLSELSNVNKSVISRLINGESKTCTVETAQNISDALRLSTTMRGLIFFAKEVAEVQQPSS